MPKISLIIPCYNEEESIPLFYEATKKVLATMPVNYELIFIDDGSHDNTLTAIKSLCKDNCVKYLVLSRNFGKEAAIYAGLKSASGDYIATMDVDLQDPPALLPTMYDDLANNRFDCVGTRRISRVGEPKIRSFFARLFYKLINKMTSVPIVDGARDYRLMTRKMVASILSMAEKERFSKGLFSYVGFRTKYIPYENIERIAGQTKWSFTKLFKYAISGIVAFTTTPLIFSLIFSIIFFITSLVLFLFALTNHFTNLVLNLYMVAFFTLSINLAFLSIIGEYISKMYLEVKNRPIYIVREDNLQDDKSLQ